MSKYFEQNAKFKKSLLNEYEEKIERSSKFLIGVLLVFA